MKLNIDPDTGKYRAVPASTPRAITASAVRINLKNPREVQEFARRSSRKNSWQSQAWDYYDYIGEIKFSANLIANTVAKIKIFPAYAATDDSIPSAVRHYPEIKKYAPIIEEVFSLLNTGLSGVSGYLRTAALSQFIAGEHYLVREHANPVYGIPERFTARSTDEIIMEPSAAAGGTPQFFIKPAPETPKTEYIPIAEGQYISRMWRNHPRYASEADSAMRGILDDCDDLLTYAREGRILSRSRASASLLYLPDELDDSANPDDPALDDPNEEHLDDGSDDAHDLVAEHIAQALNEAAFMDEHVNHYAPIIIRGPASLADSIKLIEMTRPMDNLHAKMVEDKLDRILNALDIPKDLAKGLSDLKYNSGALIEDSLYNSHVEPLILLIVDQLTTGFLRPALLAQGIPEEVVEKVLVWYNPSAIMAKPTKSQAASFGYENDIISAQAWRDANGFTESDQPSQAEQARKMLRDKLALDPALTSTLLETLMPEVMNASRQTTATDRDPNAVTELTDALNSAESAPTQITESDEAIQLTSQDLQDIQDAGGIDQATPGPSQDQQAQGLIEP